MNSIHEDALLNAKDRLAVALDVPDARAALSLVDCLGDSCRWLKVGMELYYAAGNDLVAQLQQRGYKIFLDLKMHDIPNTVAKAVASAVRLDVQMLTIHASGGAEMLRAAEQSAQATALALGRTPPLVLGVTVLTSMNSNALTEIGCDANMGRQVERLAALAVASGLRGLVCSPLEIAALRLVLPASVQLVTPGIRTGAEKADDQKRTLSPREALEAGANWLVIGRPIYAAENPRAAAEKILASLH